MSNINGIEMREFEDINDRHWFSHIKNLVEEMKFGNLDLSLTVKAGKVMTVKTHSTTSRSIHNNS